MKIAIVYSKPSKRMLATSYSETDAETEDIAHMVSRGLQARNYLTQIYPISEESIDSISKIKADCIFNLIEWNGLDSQLSRRAFIKLRQLNLPVTGSSEKLYFLTDDKILLKQELVRHHLSCPRAQFFYSGKEKIDTSLPYPIIVKPSREHCSTGLDHNSLTQNTDELKKIIKIQIKKFNQPVLAEEFIVGRELLVYLLEKETKIEVLPIEEIIFANHNPHSFQTYDCKWNQASSDYQTTDIAIAQLTPLQQKNIQNLCIKTFQKLGFYGYARFDLRVRNDVPHILEANANPSVYDAEKEIENIEDEVIFGIKFPDYLQAIINSAIYHFQIGDKI